MIIDDQVIVCVCVFVCHDHAVSFVWSLFVRWCSCSDNDVYDCVYAQAFGSLGPPSPPPQLFQEQDCEQLHDY